MCYAVPLSDGSYGIAQAGAAMMTNAIYVALFADHYRELPNQPLHLTFASAVALATTRRQALNGGEWLSLWHESEVFPKAAFSNERFSSNGYVGAMVYDAGILVDFLSAYHGLLPWNVMNDPDYYDRILIASVERPKSAIILNTEECAKYRREALGVDV